MSTGNASGSRIYMDANATTPLLPEVVEAMRPYWTEHFGNASSIHLDGQQARKAIDQAREILAELFNDLDRALGHSAGSKEAGKLRRADDLRRPAAQRPHGSSRHPACHPA